MKKLFLVIICLVLITSCINNHSGYVINKNGIYVETFEHNNHKYIKIKDLIHDSAGTWLHDPDCLIRDLDSLQKLNY